MKTLTVKHLELFELKLKQLEKRKEYAFDYFVKTDISDFDEALAVYPDADSDEFLEKYREIRKVTTSNYHEITSEIASTRSSINIAITEARKQIELADHVNIALEIICE